jgi:ATP/maltotriose-dependent transcriptional regulator MalT
VVPGPRPAAEPLLARAQGRALVWACLAACYSLGRLGRLDAALAASEQGHAAHLDLSEPVEFYPWFHLFFRCDALASAGRFEEAETLATEQYQRALVERSPEAQSLFALQLAKTVGDRGHGEEAIRHAREAVALFRQLGQWQFVHFGLGCLAWALALSGQAVEASSALAALDDLHLPAALYYAGDLLQARAWVAVAKGDPLEAHKLLGEAADIGQETGDLIGEAAALHALARLGYANQVATRLSDLVPKIEGELIRARFQHADGLARRDPTALESVSVLFEELGADVLGRRGGRRGRAVLAGGGARSAGRAAQAAQRRAGMLADRCEGATTPGLQATQSHVRLTTTERTVATLAGAGHANKDIARQLEISVRTVESHLQRIYTKLGVCSRAELSDIGDATVPDLAD